jgi:hypothetical protein
MCWAARIQIRLFNAERHRSIVDELNALGVPAVGFNQW